MVVKGKWGSAACAVALTAVTVLAAGCSSGSGGSGAETIADTLPTNYGPAETTTLNVGAVPAMDSAGFFVAYNEGLFTKEGLKINYSPAASSETAIKQQLAGKLADLRRKLRLLHRGRGRRATRSRSSPRARVMQQGAQTIYVMPSSHITSLSQLKGKLVGVNAPHNIDYLLDVSVLKENGINPKDVRVPQRQGQGFRSVQRRRRHSVPRHGRRTSRTAIWRRPRCPSRSPASPSRSTARSRWPT